MTVKISKKKIIEELKQIPDENNLEIFKLLQFYRASLIKKNSKRNFKAFLKSAPTWSDDDINDFLTVNNWMNEWITKTY